MIPADVLLAEPLTKRELEEAVTVLAVPARRSRLFALSVDKKRKFLSNQPVNDQFIAEIVFKTEEVKNISR